MLLNRRDVLAGLGGLVAAPAPLAFSRSDRGQAAARSTAVGFPRKSDFAIAEGYTYLSGAFTHPMPVAAAEAYREAVTRRVAIGAPFPAAPSYGPTATTSAGPTANAGPEVTATATMSLALR